jgi:hypothetical protein
MADARKSMVFGDEFSEWRFNKASAVNGGNRQRQVCLSSIAYLLIAVFARFELRMCGVSLAVRLT